MKSPFISFLSKKEQLIDLGIFTAVAVAICVLMRIFYPFPFSYPDTGAYVLSASSDVYNVYRPMGFSNYLSFLHVFSDSIYFIFYATYFLLFLSTLTLLFSAKYILGIKNRWIFLIFGLLMLTNARMIFSCNLLMSDGIFLVLSIYLFATLIWLIYKPSIILVGLNLILLLFLCKIRYSGLFFFPLSILALFLGYRGRKPLLQATVICLPVILGIWFYQDTKTEYARETSTETFSGFGGWQSINNASVLFPEAKNIPVSEFRTKQLKNLHTFLQARPDDCFENEKALSTSYIWDNNLPYKIYNSYLLSISYKSYTDQWAASGKLYGDYSKVLIRKYPFKYLESFVIPSFFSNFKFKPFEENNIDFVNEEMYRRYYGITVDRYSQKCHFFDRIEPLRKVLQLILWIALGIAAISYFAISINKESWKDKRTVILLFLLVSVFLILGGQSVSSPNTTWRYTMPILAPMFTFITGEAELLLGRFGRLRP